MFIAAPYGRPTATNTRVIRVITRGEARGPLTRFSCGAAVDPGLRRDGNRVEIGGSAAPFRSTQPTPLSVQGPSFVMMIVPEAANMPPTPWQTEILAPGTWAGAMPRIWRTLSWSAYMPYMPECM
jgi:hypothetical protein